MEIDLLNPININKLLNRLDNDCATRLVLSAIRGRSTFLKQLNMECIIQSKRDGKEVKEEDELIEEG